jgi:hypothetical protein
VLFVFKLLEHVCRRSPQGEPIIDEVGNISCKCEGVDDQEQVFEYLPVIKIKPDVEWENHQENEQRIQIQNSAEVESDTACFKAKEIPEGHFRKEGCIEKVKSNPADGEHEHAQSELKSKSDIDIMPVGQTFKKMIRFQDISLTRRK